MGLSAVCDCVFPDHTHLLFLLSHYQAYWLGTPYLASGLNKIPTDMPGNAVVAMYLSLNIIKLSHNIIS